MSEAWKIKTTSIKRFTQRNKNQTFKDANLI